MEEAQQSTVIEQTTKVLAAYTRTERKLETVGGWRQLSPRCELWR